MILFTHVAMMIETKRLLTRKAGAPPITTLSVAIMRPEVVLREVEEFVGTETEEFQSRNSGYVASYLLIGAVRWVCEVLVLWNGCITARWALRSGKLAIASTSHGAKSL